MGCHGHTLRDLNWAPSNQITERHVYNYCLLGEFSK